MLYFSSPACAFSNQPETFDLVRKTAANLRRAAEAKGSRLVTIGVSPSWIPEEGWEHLREIMAFDEVVVGRNWMNSAAFQHIWNDLSASGATPQVVVYQQTLTVPEPGGRPAIDLSPVLVRILGLSSLRRWTEAGNPLTYIDASGDPDLTTTGVVPWAGS